MIIPAEKRHARQMAGLHHKYIKSLLRDLGRRMCFVFYETALRSDDNFGCVYIEKSEVFGFVFGTRDNSRLFNHPRIYLEIVFDLCRRPLLIKRIVFRLSNKFPPAPELSYIAVDPHFRRKGIGEQLLLTQNEAFKKRGITCYEVGVDADNIPSLLLFQKLGAKIRNEFRDCDMSRFRLYNKIGP